MKRRAVFIKYFQSPFQIVHLYELLLSEYFFQKIGASFNLTSIFLNFEQHMETSAVF